MSSDDKQFGSVIAILEARYVEAQKAADEKLAALNVVRHEAGMTPRSPGVDPAGDTNGSLTQIKRDSFYGMKQMSAIRLYMEMRRNQGDGPATPREVYDALKAGGYPFDTKSDDIALVGIRSLLRKANNVFHKLPGTGSYGLLSWYPTAKPGRQEGDRAAPKRRRGRPRKVKRAAVEAPKQLEPPKQRDQKSRETQQSGVPDAGKKTAAE